MLRKNNKFIGQAELLSTCAERKESKFNIFIVQNIDFYIILFCFFFVLSP